MKFDSQHPDTSKFNLQGSFYVDKEGFYRYINPQGYEHCNHRGKNLIPVVQDWGNKYFVCSCGKIAKSELTSTSL